MFQKFLIIAVALLLLWLPVQAHATPTIEGSFMYNSKDVMGHLIPHLSDHPSSGMTLLLDHPVGIPDGGLTAGISGVSVQRWQDTGVHGDAVSGHTSAFVGVHWHTGIVHLSAQERYMHAMSPNNRDFFQGDAYETLLKAGLTVSDNPKPYLFLGMVQSAYVPVDKAIGIIGAGLATRTAVHPLIAINTESSIATTLFNFNFEKETFAKMKAALAFNFSDAAEIEAGLNIHHDLLREEYHSWWSVRASYAF
ncbi:MAG: hypothetical protein OXB96_00630 [Candidatus Kaiserbacteria bacterium]|nr:hypothetical protein [Candidatus Kaiserbacteria bacterium]